MAVCVSSPASYPYAQRRSDATISISVRSLWIAAILTLGFTASCMLMSRPACLTFTKTISSAARLQLLHVETNCSDGYADVIGEVSGLEHRSLKDVVAVVELLDSKGMVVGVESALVTDSAVKFGQPTSFVVHLRQSSAATSFRIAFRLLSGPRLGYTI